MTAGTGGMTAGTVTRARAKRLLSYSEISKVLDCEASWDFAYGGHLAGDALAPKNVPVLLREGRAWGRGVAALHAGDLAAGHEALDVSLEEDADQQREVGMYLAEEHEEIASRLHPMLDHYAASTGPLPITSPEYEIEVPIPARTGSGRSNRYRLLVYLDGLHVDGDGREWIVEYKLRKQLSPVDLIARSRQIRWQAWAAREALGIDPVGVIVDERLNAVPEPVRFNADGRPSKVQACTAEAYLAGCRESRHLPHEDVLEKLRQKRWQHREPVLLRQTELDRAGRELVSAAQLVRELDSGARYPIRNPTRPNCNGCWFRDVCDHPEDVDLIDALYERRPAKRDREGVAA